MDRQALLREAKRRKKLYPTTAALRLAGLYFAGPSPVHRLRQALEDAVAFLPTGLLMYLTAHASGYLVVAPEVPPGLPSRRSCYVEGPVAVEGRTFHNAIFLLAADLARGEGVAQHEVAHLLDHLLGSDGRPGERYLSEGVGATPELVELGQRLLSLYRQRPRLGYRVPCGPRSYFARSVQEYCVRPATLEQEDPEMYRFLNETFLAEAFWSKGGCLEHSG